MHLRCFFLIGQTLSIIFDMKVVNPSRESCLNNISWHLTTSAFVFQLLISEGVELKMVIGLLPVFSFLRRSLPVLIGKINDLQLKFCVAVGLVKDRKVVRFGLNPISQFRTK